MRILQVIPALEQGGAEHFTVELTNELVKLGYDCDLVTLFDVAKDNALLNELDENAHHYSLNKHKGYDVKCYFRLCQFIKKGEYDVVHAHVGAIPYLLLASVLLSKRVKFVATIHSEARREAGKSIMKWSRYFLFKHNKCTPVTISEESKISFDRFYSMDAPLVYNGVSDYEGTGIDSIRDCPDQWLFIHPASCQPVKNQALLIKAFARLVEDYPNSKMIWMGRKDSYQDLYQELVPDMVEQFKFIGPVSNVRDYLIQSDAMCLSSKMEGMPMTIIEAFSVGCPAICTPVGGIVNMIEDGENGMLSKSLSVDDYYLTLKRFCQLSFEKRRQMKQNAKKSFSKYSIESTALGYIEIYEETKQ